MDKINKTFELQPGTLYVTATPIGNLSDITLRALEVLKNCDFVVCEDTKQTLKLLNHYEIKKRLISSNSFKEMHVASRIISELEEGKSAALVTDNGTPGISDPGSILVKKCREKGIKIVPIPGASAVCSLLSVCGWNTSPFVFLGFLSNKSGRRKNEISLYKDFPGVIVIYESPHRIKKTIADLFIVLGDKEIVIGREISKIYEEILLTKLSLVADNNINITEKGEFVIAIKN